MKRFWVIFFAVCLLSRSAFAVIGIALDAPQDDLKVRKAKTVHDLPEAVAIRNEYQSFLEKTIFKMKCSTITNMFGPLIKADPPDRTLPVYDWGGRMISGIHHVDPALNHDHRDWHALGNIGYVEIYYGINGQSVAAFIFYPRADDKFVPLNTTDDLPKRLRWDKEKYEEMKKWITEHLPKDS